jgi:predicted transglutaminase-like cysteine proteinase
MRTLNLPLVLVSLSFLGACASIDNAPTSLASESGGTPAETSLFMPTGAVVDAPWGYTDMCQNRPQLCVDGVTVASNRTPAAPGAKAAASDDQTGAIDPPAPLTASPRVETLGASASWTSRAPSEAPRLLLRASWNGFRSFADAPPTPAIFHAQPWAGRPDPLAPPSSAGPAALPAPFADAAPAPTATDAPQAPADGQPARLPVATRLKMLETVDRYVNDHVRQATDMEVYGVPEYWNRSGVGPHARGDCEDLAIEKRFELIEQGYPAADLFYAVAYRRDLGLHAVLVAHTELGDLVLDSRTPYVMLWSHAPYTWVKRQTPGDSSTWALIDTGAPKHADVRIAALDLSGSRGAPASAR